MSARQTKPTFKLTFLYGIMSGIGWAFGATVGFALLIGLSITVFGTLEQLPFMGPFFANLSAIAKQAQLVRISLPR